MAVDIIARGMAGNGGSGGVDQSYVDAQDRKTLNSSKAYSDELAIEYIGREQQVDFNATLEGNIITATLDETISDFIFTNNTGYLFHIYLPLVTLTGDLSNEYEIILKDKDNNTININCMFQKDITKTSTVGDLCQIQDYDIGIGYSWEFYGNYREITENGTLVREVYTDTVIRETNPSMTGEDLHLAIANSKLKVGSTIMCTTDYENNGSVYYAGETYRINGDYSTEELILTAENISKRGNLSELNTTEKSDIVGAINELNSRVKVKNFDIDAGISTTIDINAGKYEPLLLSIIGTGNTFEESILIHLYRVNQYVMGSAVISSYIYQGHDWLNIEFENSETVAKIKLTNNSESVKISGTINVIPLY